MATVITKAGDTAPWEFTLGDAGTPVNLSSATAVKLTAHRESSGVTVINGALVTVVADQGANTGQVTYEPAAGEVTAGVLLATLTAYWSDGTEETWPTEGHGWIRVEIQPRA